MDNAMMVGLSRQMTLRRAMDIAANNIANMTTAGFKAEHELLAERPMGKARHTDGGQQVRYVNDWGVLRDFRTGALERTGRPFDLAVQGDGFFALQTEQGVQYTRDGRFTLDAEGGLIAQDGAAVLDETGAPVVIPPGMAEVNISPSGAIESNGVELGRLQIVDFATKSVLEKAGDGRFSARGQAEPEPVEEPNVRQGFYEASNVNPVMELTRMLDVSRTYQSVSKMIQESADLSKRAIERIGSTQR